MIRSTIYQQDLHWFYARNVKSRAFQEGDLVLQVDQQKPHKLAPTWEGPSLLPKFSTTEHTVFTTSIARLTSHELGMRICSAPFILKYSLGWVVIKVLLYFAYQRQKCYNFPIDCCCFCLCEKSPSGWLSCKSISPKFVKKILPSDEQASHSGA